MKEISIESKLENRGHYVPGIVAGGMLYISGQLPVHHETGAPISGDAAQQTADALNNVDMVLKSAGLTKENIAMCRIYIPDIQYWDIVNETCAKYFGSHKPARIIVPSRELHGGALVEIEAIAEMVTRHK